jgi:hypothetical protein
MAPFSNKNMYAETVKFNNKSIVKTSVTGGLLLLLDLTVSTHFLAGHKSQSNVIDWHIYFKV